MEELSKPSFWIAGIVLALIVNIASAYIKPWIDRWAGNYSTARKEKNTKRQLEFENEIALLAKDPLSTLKLKTDLIYYEVRKIVSYIGAITIFIARDNNIISDVVQNLMLTVVLVGLIVYYNVIRRINKFLKALEKKTNPQGE